MVIRNESMKENAKEKIQKYHKICGWWWWIPINGDKTERSIKKSSEKQKIEMKSHFNELHFIMPQRKRIWILFSDPCVSFYRMLRFWFWIQRNRTSSSLFGIFFFFFCFFRNEVHFFLSFFHSLSALCFKI